MCTTNKTNIYIVGAVLVIAAIFTWKAAQDAYSQIESAEALDFVLHASDDLISQCIIVPESDDHLELKKLNKEKGLICLDDGRTRILWNGKNIVDINCALKARM